MSIPSLWPYTIQDVTEQQNPWNLEMVNAGDFWNDPKGGKGDGAVIAFLDTGIDASHPEFKDRIIDLLDMTGDGINDTVGHGTHVASIGAGITKGVAPEARIMAVKGFPSESGKEDQTGIFLEEGLRSIWNYNKVAPDADKVVVVNCSWGSQSYNPNIAFLIRALVAQGVTVVASAGNSGDGDPNTCEIFNMPAYLWECLTVGAMNKDLTAAVYTNSFLGVDIGAPGTDVPGAWPGGGYKLLSGTSMAAPHISGALALIYGAWRKRKGVWPTEAQAVSVLLNHVQPLDINPAFIGAGLLDLTFDTRRWPLHKLQMGAFWFLNNFLTKQKEVEAMLGPKTTFRAEY